MNSRTYQFTFAQDKLFLYSDVTIQKSKKTIYIIPRHQPIQIPKIVHFQDM